MNNIAPGAIETEMAATAPRRTRSAYNYLVPMVRYGTPGKSATRPCSSARTARYVQGHTLNVDGGFRAAGLMFGDRKAPPSRPDRARRRPHRRHDGDPGLPPIFERWPMLLDGALVTLQLAAAATLLGFVIGTLCAIGRNSSVRWLSALCAGYVEGIRNTPFLVQIFLVFFGLSSVGITMSAFSVAIIALTINVGAYTGEIMRAGFNSVHAGQWEAAECLGLSRAQVYWHVVLRPAVERVYPSLTSQFILLMLASSITSQISVAKPIVRRM